MKAYAVGLETTIQLTEEEIKNLGHSPISGNLKFREVNEDFEKDILITLSYNLSQKELMEIKLIPKGYFGDSKEIVFSINRDFYETIKERGQYGDRFWGAGKLIVKTSKTLNSWNSFG
jgi:hypothetical protein